jgi:hypothetical protein
MGRAEFLPVNYFRVVFSHLEIFRRHRARPARRLQFLQQTRCKRLIAISHYYYWSTGNDDLHLQREQHA